MADNNYAAQVKRLGIPDKYIEHGEQLQLHIECGFDTDSIVREASGMVGVKKNTMAG
jgi:1-deoxy-D-xylulose-5-phosphate synthase